MKSYRVTLVDAKLMDDDTHIHMSILCLINSHYYMLLKNTSSCEQYLIPESFGVQFPRSTTHDISQIIKVATPLVLQGGSCPMDLVSCVMCQIFIVVLYLFYKGSKC